MKVVHVATGLETGGAETLLIRAVELMHAEGVDTSVVVLTGRGRLSPALEGVGVNVDYLDMHRVPRPRDIAGLAGVLRRARPAVVQAWMLHANVMTAAVAPLIPGRLVWGVHTSEFDAEVFGARTARLARLERWLSRVPSWIVSCAQSAEVTLREAGYPRDRISTIVNGFDTAAFRPDALDRQEVRAEIGAAPDDVVIGHFARWHPVKDHAGFLRATEAVLARHPQALFVLCGSGVDSENAALGRMTAPLGDRVRLLGERGDVARLMRGMDAGAFTSKRGEALPLVIGEAMASGLPMVATDSGDARYLVGVTGSIVPPGDVDAMAAALSATVALGVDGIAARGAAARERIEERYSLRVMVEAYVTLYERLTAPAVGPRTS